jgi:hypothetical protein
VVDGRRREDGRRGGRTDDLRGVADMESICRGVKSRADDVMSACEILPRSLALLSVTQLRPTR